MDEPNVRQFNFEPLTPTAFLMRSGQVYADRIAVIDGDTRFTYAQFLERARRLAGGLAALGVRPGDRVAVLAGNTHIMLLAHYAVPLAGAVLVSLNTRSSTADLSYIIQHAECSVMIYDRGCQAAAIATLPRPGAGLRRLCAGGNQDEIEKLIAAASPYTVPIADEHDLLAINYTSGTTAHPKGVMYHHRGAYLQSLSMALHMKLDSDSVYLWTLPMFHCNGWCFTWAVTAVGGVHLCLSDLAPAVIWHHLLESGITHLCAAPTVLARTIWDAEAGRGTPTHTIRIGTGGAPPTPALLERLSELGMDITHLYGLTESFGPVMLCDWRGDWNQYPIPRQAQLKARQGVGNVISQQPRIIDKHGHDVPADATTLGEIAIRGNNLMLGYYRDDDATAAACQNGWFRTGDLGVMHTDGYVELKDRAKDIIISGGENISSVEVEQALTKHPAVLEAAVVAVSDERWGEIPVAFVTLKDAGTATESELIGHVRSLLARFKAPKKVIFGTLPKTSTGKVQKHLLRARLR
jgi:fatty-acyl-CoA synthase